MGDGPSCKIQLKADMAFIAPGFPQPRVFLEKDFAHRTVLARTSGGLACTKENRAFEPLSFEK